ncbi:LacI family DNA-binding transcriptional regulator [Streptomyces griseoluteus]|uniref:LacI family DNA-binding transcriptional regulator n=1 Tax=Streptomyces griseoluteus TaxID=29306 RepID=UPI0034167FB5
MADVARAAGVSSATVSYVLSGKRAVTAEPRTAVEAAIAELGFVVNTAARRLRSGRSSLVALIAPDIANPFFVGLGHRQPQPADRASTPAPDTGTRDTAAEWSGATLTGFGLPVPDLPDGDCASAPARLRRVA